jgi:aspartate 1-decarboxylase
MILDKHQKIIIRKHLRGEKNGARFYIIVLDSDPANVIHLWSVGGKEFNMGDEVIVSDILRVSREIVLKEKGKVTFVNVVARLDLVKQYAVTAEDDISATLAEIEKFGEED